MTCVLGSFASFKRTRLLFVNELVALLPAFHKAIRHLLAHLLFPPRLSSLRLLSPRQAKTACLSAILFIPIITLAEPGPNALTQQLSDRFAPETGSALRQDPTDKTGSGKQFIVVSANPYATNAGIDILEAGGNAIDAMVTIQLVLGLVEPQSSGLGGGAFLLFYDAMAAKLRSVDARETAPRLASENLFLDSDGQTMGFFEAVVGGRSVGTPGTPKLLWEMHRRFGVLPWQKVLAPAIALAQNGFVVSPRLSEALKRDQDKLAKDQDARDYFYPDGVALQAGTTHTNAAYADTLLKLSGKGGNHFYSAEFARAISDKVRSHSNPGTLSIKDFEDYRVIERPPVCAGFLEYDVCGMGPPSSGAISVGQTLGIAEAAKLKLVEPESVQAWHIVSEASRLAFADRGKYIADTDFVPMPSGLLNPDYLQLRSRLIDTKTSSPAFSAGVPPGTKTPEFQTGRNLSQASTTHFVIVDKQQNIISMTSTIEHGFGSRLMVGGFLLNNELTDFSFKATQNDMPIANRVEAGKRPRSSMAPTIVFKGRQPVLALGSPGGSRIINYVANTLIRTLAWGQRIDLAISKPHFVNRFGALDIESGTPAVSLSEDFGKRGFEVSVRDLNSGLHAVQRIKDTWFGAADHRREGSVRAR